MAILSAAIAGEITGPHGPGRSDISAGWRTWLQAWDEFSIEAKEMVKGVVHGPSSRRGQRRTDRPV